MIFYFITLIFCFFLDQWEEDKSRGFRICIAWIFIFLCFGYMTGSDWRNYELVYYNDSDDYLGKCISRGEFVPALLMLGCSKIGLDYWIFSGLTKIFYLWSFIKLGSLFSNYKWTYLGISFISGTLLFMTIDGPFRFMLAMAFINVSILKYIDNKKIYAVISILLALACHSAAVVVVAFVGTVYFAKYTERIKNAPLIVGYFTIYYLVLGTNILGFFGEMYNILSFEDRFNSYSNDEALATGVKDFISFGTLRYALVFLLVVLNRESILRHRYGNIVFHYAVLWGYVSLIVKIIPTGFRLSILLESFVYISILYIIKDKLVISFLRNKILVSLILIGSFYSLCRDLYSYHAYIPYSNSIPYIVGGHKDYVERYNHNFIEYQKRTGKSWTRE